MRLWATCLLACLAAPLHAACDDGLCTTPMGTYAVVTPKGDGPHPALIFLHGAGGKAEVVARNRTRAVDRGYVLIAPQGLQRPGSRFGSTWSFHPDWPPVRNETAFLREVIADAVARHGVDPARILLGGFSIGGSMTSYLACATPDLARAYAPVGGSFWRPHPPLDACTGPVDLFHTHGWTDGTVPIEGRPIGGGRITQGDVFYALQIWRDTNGCDGLKADRFEMAQDVWRRVWDSCAGGSLEFALTSGGHVVPDGWDDMVLDWFEGLD